MTEERWLPIEGYEGLYEVSDLGRVRSQPRPRTRGGLLSLRGADHGGYKVVCLCKEGKEKFVRVHTLVLEAFEGPKPEEEEALHGNGDPADNRFANLSWGTKSQNAQDTVRHGNCPLTAENRAKRRVG